MSNTGHWTAMFPKEEGKVLIFEHYGIAPSVVFRNPNLSIGAKAVYGYLMTFVNGEQARRGDVKAWPSRDRMMYELAVSKNTLTKYIRELREAKLIEIEQQHAEGGPGAGFSNNIYLIQPYIPDPKLNEGQPSSDSTSSPLPKTNAQNGSDLCVSNSGTHKECEQNLCVPKTVTHKNCDAQNMTPSITSPFSITKNTSITNLSSESERERARQEILKAKQETASTSEQEESKMANSEELDERDLRVDDLISIWNKHKVSVHTRFGSKTKERIRKAWASALEDFTQAELFAAIENYSDLYRRRKCDHRYRLVEFLERKGYEHFANKENWTSRTGSATQKTKEDLAHPDPTHSFGVSDLISRPVEPQKPFEDKEVEFKVRLASYRRRLGGMALYSGDDIDAMVTQGATTIRNAIDKEWKQWEENYEKYLSETT